MFNQPFFALFSRFGRFHEDFPLKEGTVRVPLPFSRNLPENHSHNMWKSLGKGLGLLCAARAFHLSFSPSLSYLSLPLYISPSTFLSLCLTSIILFDVSNGRFHPFIVQKPESVALALILTQFKVLKSNSWQFLDLHFQIPWNHSIYLRWRFFVLFS